jgi:DNA-binding CsgD family transcriptional regulator
MSDTTQLARLPDRIARLTKRQRDCLELVAQGYTSKEIGRRLGISFSTVDNHIQMAVQLLEVEGRAEAGRLFVQFAEIASGQRLPSEPRALADAGVDHEQSRAEKSGGRRSFLASILPPIGGKENALTPSQTFLAIVRIAFIAALAFAACVMVVRMSFELLA